MFSNLGLLSSARCPDPSCGRPRCFFSHARASSSRQPLPIPKAEASSADNEVNPNADSGRGDVPSFVREPVKRGAEEDEKERARNVVRKLMKTQGQTGPQPASNVDSQQMSSNRNGAKGIARPTNPITISSSAAAATPSSAPTPTLKTAAASTSTSTAGPPILPINLKPTPVPRPDRQKGLISLYTQYAKLYRSILHLAPDLAHQSAFAQELDVISTSSSNPRIYKTAIHQAAVSISRRPVPDSVSHPSIGTVKESRVATEKAEKEKASKLTRQRVERHCLPLDQFPTWRYPNPNEDSLTGPETGLEPNAEGTEKDCSRCKVPFIVSSKDLEKRFGECRFHYGRTAPERVEGRRKWIYSCCGRERGEQGCEEGIHVFTDGEDDSKLAKRVGYKTVKQCAGEGGGLGAGNEVVAIDCEMINTTAGVSLGRVTIVDQDGEILLDELVRQTVPILDVNTRFSGISPGQLDLAVMDLPAVRAAACMFIGPDTIIVGHGLENDLRALRLLHDKIIDTAVVFPHDKGPPFRRALRDIVKEKLGYFIQDRTSDLGHSSAVDAKSTLDALKWKVREDNE